MKRRTTMRRLCDGKMWKAVDAMIKGLKKQSKRKGFIVDMDLFGKYDYDKHVCVGCAATCAIQHLSGVSFKGNKIEYTDTRSEFVNVTYNDLGTFEYEIDAFRRGYLLGSIGGLLLYFNIKKILFPAIMEQFELLPPLENDTWKEHLPKYQKFCDYLKKLDV